VGLSAVASAIPLVSRTIRSVLSLDSTLVSHVGRRFVVGTGNPNGPGAQISSHHQTSRYDRTKHNHKAEDTCEKLARARAPRQNTARNQVAKPTTGQTRSRHRQTSAERLGVRGTKGDSLSPSPIWLRCAHVAPQCSFAGRAVCAPAAP
jgi:hypothetical protein